MGTNIGIWWYKGYSLPSSHFPMEIIQTWGLWTEMSQLGTREWTALIPDIWLTWTILRSLWYPSAPNGLYKENALTFFSALYFKNSRPDWCGDLGKMTSDRKTREMVIYFAKCCWTSIQNHLQIVTYFRYSSDLPVRQACRSLQTRGNSPPWKPYKEKSWEAANPPRPGPSGLI